MPQTKSDDQPQGITLTQEQWDQMLANQNALREQNEKLWQQMNIQRAEPVQLPKEEPIELDINGLPNPQEDVEGYHKGLGERLSQTFTKMTDAATAKALSVVEAKRQESDIANQAWDKFLNEYPEYEGMDELVQTAATKVAQELGSKGVNFMMALQNDQDGVLEMVAERTKTAVEKIQKLTGNEPEPTDDLQPWDDTSLDDMFGRTTLVEGRSGPRTPPSARKQTKPEDDFVSSMKKVQSELRLY